MQYIDHIIRILLSYKEGVQFLFTYHNPVCNLYSLVAKILSKILVCLLVVTQFFFFLLMHNLFFSVVNCKSIFHSFAIIHAGL